MTRGISVLGSTGSIGVQTLDVVRLHPKRFKVIALAAGSNVDLLERQVREFRPSLVSCSGEFSATELKGRLGDFPNPPEIAHSGEGLIMMATAEDADLVVGGLPGSAGLRPCFAAVESGKDLALATKEVLVMAGELFMRTVGEMGNKLLPVDSEQSAVFQCLQGNQEAEVKRLILTASGGPFRGLSQEALAKVTPTEALRHPRWKMGPKVTVDSATLMNKGLEVIEARWLFNVPASRIEVVIHPESIVHSMVEFIDGSVLAQLGATDMRVPISHALAWPERIEAGTKPVSFPALGALHFEKPDTQRFPLLGVAYEVLQAESNSPAIVMNAADEVAVALFLKGKIPFYYIARIVLESLDRTAETWLQSLEDIEHFHNAVVERVRTDWKTWALQ